MKNFLRWIHRWVGLPLGILFFVTLLTGVITGGKTYIDSFDKLGQTYRPTTIIEDTLALEKITSEMTSLRFISMPTKQMPYYQGRARGLSRSYSIGDLALIDETTSSRTGFFSFMLRLHRSFLMGRDLPLGFSGQKFTAWVSLFAVVISLIGIYLWWPFRKVFSVKGLVPKKHKRREYLLSHHVGGIVTVVVIVMLGLSGAGMVYRPVSRTVLNAEQTAKTGLEQNPLYVKDNWESWLKTAQDQMPGGQLVTIANPRRATPPVFGAVNTAQATQFRFQTPQDWLGVAGSIVYIDRGQSALIGAANFSELGFGQKLYNVMRPLHTGRSISMTYLVLLLLLTIFATISIYSSVVSMLMSLLKKKRKKGTVAVITKRLNDPLATVSFRSPVTNSSLKQGNSEKKIRENYMTQFQKLILTAGISSVVTFVVMSAFPVKQQLGPKDQVQTAEAMAGRATNEKTKDGQMRGRGSDKTPTQSSEKKTGKGKSKQSTGPAIPVYDFNPTKGFSVSQGEKSLAKMSIALGLTPEQQIEIRVILEDANDNAKPLRKKMSAAHNAIASYVPISINYAQNIELIDDTSQSFKELLALSVMTRSEINFVLTERQRNELSKLRSKNKKIEN